MKQYNAKIEGMSCGHCELTVKEAIETIEDVKVKKISASKGNAVIFSETGVSSDQIINALKPTGYMLLEIKEEIK